MILQFFALLLSLGGVVDQAPAPENQRLFLSVDQGNSWRTFGEGLPEEVTPRAVLNHANGLYLATDANGVYFRSSRSSAWERRGKGLPQNIDINSIAADGDRLAIGTFWKGVFLSFNGGESWTPSIFNLRAGSVQSLLFHNGILMAGTDGGTFRSGDGGMSWERISDIKQTNDLYALDGRLYAARQNGIFVSEDDGDNWQKVYDQPTAYRFMEAEGKLYARLMGGGVVRTENGGKSWDLPIGGIKTNNTATLPEKIWFGYTPELPETNLYLRFITETPMGWVAAAVPDGC